MSRLSTKQRRAARRRSGRHKMFSFWGVHRAVATWRGRLLDGPTIEKVLLDVFERLKAAGT